MNKHGLMDGLKKRTMVVGMARSGVAAAELLAAHGATVFLNDNKNAAQLSEMVSGLHSEAYIDIMGKNPVDYLNQVDQIVVSPGVPPTVPLFAAAKEKGVPILAEIELGYRATAAPIVAIGGTNGKTTTTSLVGEIFRTNGNNTFVLGNIGEPLCSAADQAKRDDIIVAEIASLQLETTSTFRPHSAALLNITEDHLDRFGNMDRYIRVKAMMFENQTQDDFAVLNADDPLSQRVLPFIRAQLLHFSRHHAVEQGAFVRDGQIVFRFAGKEQIIAPVSSLRIPGAHNLENALAAVAVSMPLGVEPERVAQALARFPGVEHRIEFVRERDGVQYINDSKATNPDSAIKAVEAMTRPTVLISGGSNKNSDYKPLFEAFGGRIKAVVALGETAPQIVRDANATGYADIHVCGGSFEDGVRMARDLAEKGDTVLLSPACASYDMFTDYEQRGKVFKQIVNDANWRRENERGTKEDLQ